MARPPLPLRALRWQDSDISLWRLQQMLKSGRMHGRPVGETLARMHRQSVMAGLRVAAANRRKRRGGRLFQEEA